MSKVPHLISSLQAWSCWIIWIIVIRSQLMYADSKPINRTIDIARCYNISRNLVNVVTDTLSKLHTKSGWPLDCSYEAVDIEDITKDEMNTIRACLPSMHSRSCICSSMNRTEVDEDKCLTAIHSDLKSFQNELQDLNPSINEIIKSMMQALNVPSEDRMEENKIFSPSFSRGLKQCGTILSFRLRTITISRILSVLKHEGLHQHKTRRH